MRNRRPQLLTQKICCLVAAISSMIIMASAVAAHQGRRPPGSPDLKREQRDREQREAALRTAETTAAVDKLDQKRIEASIKQVKEDFRHIQIVRNEIVRNLLADKPLDYKLVASEAGEISKRADRLKTFLMPPTPEDKDKNPKNQVEFNSEEIKEALVRLCNQIASFVENPVLKTPDRIDVEESRRAGGDLLSIIELSSIIKRSAERLGKTSK